MKRVSSLLLYIALLVVSVASLPAQNVTGKGTPGTIPIWTGTNTIGNSIITQSGGTVTVDGELEGSSTTGTGVMGISESGEGVLGNSKESYGVEGESTSSYGVLGVSNSHHGVHGESTSSEGVFGVSVSDAGVEGFSTSNAGVVGESKSHIGVAGLSTSGTGTTGTSSAGTGVQGISDSSWGVLGLSTKYRGVEGQSQTLAAVAGISVTGDGIGGVTCDDCDAAAVFGQGKQAGIFDGNVGVKGERVVTGFKQFHIDHPLDPANKYLNHFAIESNEVLNTYSGNIITDLGGLASVQLPRYFQALNTNYRYQLTVIGEFAQAIIFQEIQNNRFVVKTDKPSVKVSWQVTGVRSDAYAKAHPVPVEERKRPQERGHYLTPELYGQPEEMSVYWLYHSDLMSDAKALEEKRKALGLSTKR
jgi:hypothetical protein